jgi:hypothetical protein
MRKAWEQSNDLADGRGAWDKKVAVDAAIFLPFFRISNFHSGRTPKIVGYAVAQLVEEFH